MTIKIIISYESLSQWNFYKSFHALLFSLNHSHSQTHIADLEHNIPRNK